MSKIVRERGGTGRGAPTDEEVRALRAEADLFISMQAQRGLDKAVLEAMASGLPVIAANTSFEPLLGERAGEMLFPPSRPEGLGERLLAMAGLSPAQRREIGLGLRERVAAEHGLGGLMDRILALAGEAGAGRGTERV